MKKIPLNEQALNAANRQALSSEKSQGINRSKMAYILGLLIIFCSIACFVLLLNTYGEWLLAIGVSFGVFVVGCFFLILSDIIEKINLIYEVLTKAKDDKKTKEDNVSEETNIIEEEH